MIKLSYSVIFMSTTSWQKKVLQKNVHFILLIPIFYGKIKKDFLKVK